MSVDEQPPVPPPPVGARGAARAARIDPSVRGDAPLRRALGDFAAAAVRNDEVDPITTELVRLRCAAYHDCHT